MFQKVTPYKATSKPRGSIGHKIAAAMQGIVAALTGLDKMFYPKEKVSTSPLADLATDTEEDNVAKQIGEAVKTEYLDFCRAAKTLQLAIQKAEEPFLKDEESEAKKTRDAVSKALTDGIGALINNARQGMDAVKQGFGE